MWSNNGKILDRKRKETERGIRNQEEINPATLSTVTSDVLEGCLRHSAGNYTTYDDRCWPLGHIFNEKVKTWDYTVVNSV